MSAPVLQPAHFSDLSPALVSPRDLSARGITCVMRVQGAGRFGGHQYQVGDAIFVGGPVRVGATVVLTARGYGRPRLGSVDWYGLRGDAGEACSAARWQAAGVVLGVVPNAFAASPGKVGRPAAAASGQLSLLSWDRQAA